MLAYSIAASFVDDIFAMYPLVSLVILLVAFKLYWPKIAGWLGEAAVKRALARLPAKHYHVLHDVLLPCSDGETAQIDHIVIGRSAVYAIETKNFNGAVYGQEKEANWTVAYNRWRKHRFQNPFRQNYCHIKAIQEAAGSDLPVQNLVVFVRGTFPRGKPDRVLSPAELVRYIRTAEQDSQASNGVTGHALSLIHDAMIMDPQAGKQHIRRLQERFGGTMMKSMIAHGLVVLAVLVFVVGAVHTESRKAAAAIADMIPHAQSPAGSGDRAAMPQPQRPMALPVPSVRIPQPNGLEIWKRHHVMPIQILGSGAGVASVKEDGNVYTLHIGDTTPLGWKLVAATAKGVDMIRPDGQPFHMDW